MLQTSYFYEIAMTTTTSKNKNIIPPLLCMKLLISMKLL
jgi:hypothetical protein